MRNAIKPIRSLQALRPVWCVRYQSPEGNGTLQIWHGDQPAGVGYVVVEDIIHHARGSDIVVRFSAEGKMGRKVLHSKRHAIYEARPVLLWQT